MATIIAGSGFDLAALHLHLLDRLPVYARPVFVRIGRALETTGTFKSVKGALVRDGFDPSRTDDAIYFDDRSAGTFVRLDADLFAAICRGRVRI
jgi:fatty-acyl-CoA synthase